MTGVAGSLEVTGLETTFRTQRGWLSAVDDISFSVEAGTTLAIVGESGSGKSALVRSIMGLYPPSSSVRRKGTILLGGRDISLLQGKELQAVRGRQISMIFQDPMSSLNPVMKIGSQITEVLKKHMEMTSTNARVRAIELLASVGISAPERRCGQYPMHLSGGMRQRVAIAIALAAEPQLLIADEPTTALDVTIQAQILELLFRLKRERQMSMLLISHNLALVAGNSDTTMVMYAGKAVEVGPTRSVIAAPRMPYTAALLAASPLLHGPRQTRYQAIPGSVPDMTAPPNGCRFQARCSRMQDVCRKTEPQLEPAGNLRSAACHFPLNEESVN